MFPWCAVFTNAPGLRDLVVMRVLSDFYWRLVQKFSRFFLRHQNMSRLACVFWGSALGGLSHQSCMSLHIGTNNVVDHALTTRRDSQCLQQNAILTMGCCTKQWVSRLQMSWGRLFLTSVSLFPFLTAISHWFLERSDMLSSHCLPWLSIPDTFFCIIIA